MFRHALACLEIKINSYWCFKIWHPTTQTIHPTHAWVKNRMQEYILKSTHLHTWALYFFPTEVALLGISFAGFFIIFLGFFQWQFLFKSKLNNCTSGPGDSGIAQCFRPLGTVCEAFMLSGSFESGSPALTGRQQADYRDLFQAGFLFVFIS